MIKHLILKNVLCLLAFCLCPFSIMAMDMHHDTENIHTSTVDGHTLTYQLMDMRENIKAMDHKAHMESMTRTHHLMVFIKGPSGPVSGKTGFMVSGPDGKTEKVMCMAMGEGYGADVTMAKPGSYTIKTRVAAGDKVLKDSFTYDLAP